MSGPPNERDRLMRVAQGLAKALGTGGASAPRRLPVVQAGDAAGLVAMMHEQLDQAIARRDADIASEGIELACGRGCNACCALPVMLGDHEAVAIARWLAQPEHAAERERFLAAYEGWRGALGGVIEEVVEAPDLEAHRQACAVYFSRRAMCPLNHEGDCSVYEVRPALCRTTHAINGRERCQEQTAAVQTVSHPAVDDAYEGQEVIRTALHASLRPGRKHELMPKAVLRRLTRASAFPNRPCPCGSGKKHKVCCGMD
jgi:Fe-S-cluster containining protein